MRITIEIAAATAGFETDIKRASREADKALKQVEKQARIIGTAVAAGLAAAAVAVVSLTKRSIDAADAMAKMSQKVGVSVEKLSGLQHAANLSGVSVQQLQTGLVQLARRSAEAAAGMGESVRAFDALGIKTTDTNGKLKSTEQLLGEVANKFAGYEDGAAKSALATQVFGKAGANLIPLLNGGAEGLAAMQAEAEALGLVISTDTAKAAEQFNDNLSRLTVSVGALGNDIAAELLPTLVDLTNQTVAWVQQLRADGTLKEWGDAIREAAKWVDDLAIFIGTKLVAGALISMGAQLVSVTAALYRAAAAGKALNIVLAANPIGLITTLVAAAAAGIYYLATQEDEAAEATAGLIRATDLLAAAQGNGLRPAIETARLARENAKAALEDAQAQLTRAESFLEVARTRALADRSVKEGIGPGQGTGGLLFANTQERVEVLRESLGGLNDSLAESGAALEEAEKRAAEWDEKLRQLGGTAGQTAAPIVQLGKATDDLTKAITEQIREEERLAKARLAGHRAIEDLLAELEGPMARAVLAHKRAIEDLTAAYHTGELALADYAVGLGLLEEQNRRQVLAIREQGDVLGRFLAQIEADRALIGLTARQHAVAEAVRAVTAAYMDNTPAAEQNAEALAHIQQTASQATAELYDLARNAEVWRDGWESAIGDTSQALARLFTDGKADFGEFADAIVDAFQNALQRMLSAWIESGITNLFSGSISGGGGGGLSGFFTNLFSGGGGGAGFVGPPSGLANQGVSTAATSGGFGNVGGAFASNPAGWIAAGMMINTALFNQGWRPGGGSLTLPNGESVRGGGSPLANGLDNFNNLLTGGLGNLFGSQWASMITGSAVINRLFGRKAPELTGSQATFTVGAAPGGSQSFNTLEEGGVFRSDRRRTHTFDLGAEAMAYVQQLFDDLTALVETRSRQLGSAAPALADAAIRIIEEYNDDGTVKAVQYWVDGFGESIQEATLEAAENRLAGENIIRVIDNAFGGMSDAFSAAFAATGTDVGVSGGRLGSEWGEMLRKSVVEGIDAELEGAGVEAVQGEAHAIAERWRGDAELLLEGAEFLFLAAMDIHAGLGLLGDEGGLTAIADLTEELQFAGEALTDTYRRMVGSTQLLDAAFEIAGQTMDATRAQFVEFATDFTTAAGGLDRAADLVNNYLETFFSAGERAAIALSRGVASAEREFGDIGQELGDFTGEGGAAAFRALFESVMPTLSAEALVHWYEAANALGIVLDLQERYTATLGVAAQTIEDLMAGVEQTIADLEPPEELSFEDRFAAINSETEALLARADELGASEADLQRIRYAGQLALNQVLEEQAAAIDAAEAAMRDQAAAAESLADYMAVLNAEATDGVSPLTAQLRSLRAEYDRHIERINELAIASGRSGASVAELGAAQRWYQAQVQRLVADLLEQASGLVAQFYGQSVGGTAGSDGGVFGTELGGISDVTAAVEDRYARELALLKSLQEYIDSLLLSDLSPLTPDQRLNEAQAQYEALLAAAQGGDLDALAGLQAAAQAYLGEAQGYYGGVGPYGDIFADVLAQLGALTGAGPINEPIEATQPQAIFGGPVVVEPGPGFEALSELDRQIIALELVEVLRDLIVATNMSLLEVADQLGLDLLDLVEALGINLNDLTVETTLQLADLSRALGIDLIELATSVGVDLGGLADAQSLLNDALEQTINSLPVGIRERLNQLLRDVENAVTEADANAAIGLLEDAVGELPPELQALLAPFFLGITTPGDDLLAQAIAQTTELTNISNTAGWQLEALVRIEGLLVAIGAGGGLPGTGGETPPWEPWNPGDGPGAGPFGDMTVPDAIAQGAPAANDAQAVPMQAATVRLLEEIAETNRRLLAEAQQPAFGGRRAG